mgnify:CR=1 FL=1
MSSSIPMKIRSITFSSLSMYCNTNFTSRIILPLFYLLLDFTPIISLSGPSERIILYKRLQIFFIAFYCFIISNNILEMGTEILQEMFEIDIVRSFFTIYILYGLKTFRFINLLHLMSSLSIAIHIFFAKAIRYKLDKIWNHQLGIFSF